MTKTLRTIDQQPAALLGLDWQWENGDKFALVEAVAHCTENGWEYPDWVRKVIGEAMSNMYKAVYPDVDLDLSKPGRKRLPEMGVDESKLADRLKKELAHSLDLLGLAIEKTNAVRRRKITIRDLHLADFIAGLCQFVPGPNPKFKGVNKAIRKLAAELDYMDGDPPLKRYPVECWGAAEHIIKRAWKRHRDEMVALYSDLPDELADDAQV